MSQYPSQEPLEGKSIEQDSLVPMVDTPGFAMLEGVSTQTKPVKKEENLFASLGFAFGFSALLFLNTYGITAVLALIFSAVALVQIKRKGEAGRAYAIWGIVLALLSLVWLGLQYLGVVTTPGMLFNFIKGLLGFST